VELVRWSEDRVALTRSALEAARSVLRADYCAVVWRPRDAALLEVIATQGISDARARERAGDWFDAALGGQPRASQRHRVEPVRDPNSDIRGALVADLRSGGVRPGVARALMPVFAAHVALLFEKVEIQARRTGAYEALVQIGMQIQAAEADVDQALQLIVDRSRDLLGTELAWMGLVNEAERTLDMRVAVGARTTPFMRMRLDLGDGVGGQVVANRKPVVVPDYARDRPPTPSWVSDAILGEGIGSMLCCPMLTGEKVVGALYVGSRRPVEFQAIEVALVSALAAQGAIAIENGRLYEALAQQNRLLEGSFAIHRTLTEAALTGAGRAHICVELARLLASEIVLEQDISPPFRARYCPSGTAPDGPDGTISVPVEDLGRVVVCGVHELTPLQAKALEHAATVLALELVKERAQQQVQWQLQGDLLSELLDASAPVAPSLVARARRHGVDLAQAHQIVAVRSSSVVADDLLGLVRRATGRSLVHRDAALVCLRGEHVLLAARDAEPVVRAITAAADRHGVTVAIGVSDGSGDFTIAHRQSMACARLALSEGNRVIHAARLGPLRFMLDAPDVSQVRAVVHEQLGSLLDYDGGRSDLVGTLRAFVAADGNVAETAKACFIHKNTLRYRLKRLADILGRDPAAPDSKFHLRMAFDLIELFAGLGIDLLPARPAPEEGVGEDGGALDRQVGLRRAGRDEALADGCARPSAAVRGRRDCGSGGHDGDPA
jgi:DNA-binding PucR family transcriptional regulator/putative methionine-R-sulfoxide reductase with GAF domain